MKVWPIITLGVLLYGSSFSDSRNVGRESNPHPHRSMIDAEVADAMKAFEPPHRPVTMAFREVFAKLLADQTEWTAPEGKATAEATDNSDDGEDPGKKLFWTTVFGKTDGVPFPGWDDPNPIPNPDIVSQPYTGPGWPNLVLIEDDPPPMRADEGSAAISSTHIQTLSEQLPASVMKALSTMVVGGGNVGASPLASVCPPGATDLLCAIIVQVCEQTPAPAACSTKKDPGDITTPLDGLPGPVSPIRPGPILTDPSPSPGPVSGVGGVPEPSTWVMIFIGALGLIGLRKRKNRLSI